MGDCVKPYGKGEIAGFSFFITEKRIDYMRKHSILYLSFTNSYDGAYIRNKDQFSKYVSAYHADTNETFIQEFSFEYNALNPKKILNTLLAENQYLVLRTRTKTNPNNEIVSAHFSKLYGPLIFSSNSISFEAFFNQLPNNTNLECVNEKINR